MAGETKGYLTAIFQRYDELSLEFASHLDSALTDIQNKEYSVDKCVQDWLYFWTKGTLGVLSPILLGYGNLPIVSVTLRYGEDEQSGEAMVLLPAGDILSTPMSEITDAGLGNAKIAMDQIEITPLAERTRIRVTFKGLVALYDAGELNVKDQLEGGIYVGDRLVAMVRGAVVPGARA